MDFLRQSIVESPYRRYTSPRVYAWVDCAESWTRLSLRYSVDAAEIINITIRRELESLLSVYAHLCVLLCSADLGDIVDLGFGDTWWFQTLHRLQQVI